MKCCCAGCENEVEPRPDVYISILPPGIGGKQIDEMRNHDCWRIYASACIACWTRFLRSIRLSVLPDKYYGIK